MAELKDNAHFNWSSIRRAARDAHDNDTAALDIIERCCRNLRARYKKWEDMTAGERMAQPAKALDWMSADNIDKLRE